MSNLSSSLSSSAPELSGSHSEKRASIASFGTLNCISSIALWNSLRETVPLWSSSQSLKRSMTRTDALASASRSCSATLLSESSSMSKRNLLFDCRAAKACLRARSSAACLRASSSAATASTAV